MVQMMANIDAKVRAFTCTLMYKLKHQERGAVDIVAIIILIAVAVGVAIIFKDKLRELVTTIMSKVNSAAGTAVDDAAAGNG